MNWLKSFGFTNADDSSQKSVNELRTHWSNIRVYFRDCHQDPNSMGKMRTQLPDVESKLNRIIGLLTKERRAFVVSLASGGTSFPPTFDYIIRGARTGVAEDGTLIPLGIEEEGQQLVTSVCQYAKLDMPEGSRALMLRFLTRLFREVDATSGTKSLLHFNNDNIAVPLFDCLSKVSAQLDPWRSNALTSKRGVLQATKAIQRDRREFTFLLEALCGQVAFVPNLSSFFLMKQVTGKQATNKSKEADVVVGSSPERLRANPISEDGLIPTPKGGNRLLLIEGVLPFIQDHVEDLTHSDRIATTRAAMRALLCIARVSDPVVQGFLLYDERVPQLVIRELCSAMVTVCKVPDLTERALHVARVLDTISFIDSVMMTNPELGGAWHLLDTHFTSNLLEGTIGPLIRADDDVYARVLDVVGFALLQGTLKAEALRKAFSSFMLGSSASAPLAPPTCIFRSILIPRITSSSHNVCRATLQFIQAFVETFPLETLEGLLGLGEFTVPDPKPVSRVPMLNVSAFFPEMLKSEVICGTKEQVFVDDILKRLLRIEGYMPTVDALGRHQPTPGPSSSDSSLPHPYFNQGVNESELALALAARLHTLPEAEADINLCATGVLTALVLLPDYRVCYTLLDDTNGGAIARAIKAVSSMIQDDLNEDRERCRVANRETGGTVSTSRLTLYKHYTQRTGFAVGGDVYQEVVQSFHAMQGSTHAMDYMGAHHVDPQLMQGVAPVSGGDVERRFVEGCVVLEGLRHELATAVGQIEMSLLLMELAI